MINIENKKRYQKKYRRSIKGFLVYRYDAQVQRCKNRPYDVLYTKEQFYDRFINDKKFLDLFYEWEKSGYKKGLFPSFDRIDWQKGYSLDNVQVMTWAQNREKSNSETATTPVVVFDINENYLFECESMKEAVQKTGCSLGNVQLVCKGIRKHSKGYVFKYRGDRFRYKNITYMEDRTPNK